MKPAKQSPRIEVDGTLRWYQGDTFSMTFNFVLKSPNGTTIDVKPTDMITIGFYDSKGPIHEFEFFGTASPTLQFTDEISNKFTEGVYRILAKFNSTNVTTLLKGNVVVVE